MLNNTNLIYYLFNLNNFLGWVFKTDVLIYTEKLYKYMFKYFYNITNNIFWFQNLNKQNLIDPLFIGRNLQLP